MFSGNLNLFSCTGCRKRLIDHQYPPMNKNVALLAISLVVAAAARAEADPLAATILKNKGNVVAARRDGGVISAEKGTGISAGGSVSTEKKGMVVYTIGENLVLKEGPESGVMFDRLNLVSAGKEGVQRNVRIKLNKGEVYAGIRRFESGPTEFEITTSELAATARGTIYKVVENEFTSKVLVKKGVVEVKYCKGTKTAFVQAGEAFSVTGCDGTRRPQTTDEARDLSDFALLLDSIFGADSGNGSGSAVNLPLSDTAPGVSGPAGGPTTINVPPTVQPASQ